MAPSTRALMARISPAFWAEDLERSSAGGRTAALQARARWERTGVPIADLRACEIDHAGGTSLPNCRKVYLPPPEGRFGAVFEVRIIERELQLVFLAFGVRHPPRNAHTPSVYEIADRRLHG
jgi:hypothetical protein